MMKVREYRLQVLVVPQLRSEEIGDSLCVAAWLHIILTSESLIAEVKSVTQIRIDFLIAFAPSM